MTGTDYQVASAAQLVGAILPKRREIDKSHFAKYKATDQSNKDESCIARNSGTGGRTRLKGGLPPSEADGGEQTIPTIVVVDTHSHVTQQTQQPLSRYTSQPEAGVSISARYQARAAKTDKITTSFDHCPDGTSGSVHNANGSNTLDQEANRLTDIYFSPIDVNKSQISLSEPLDVIHSDLTPTQERYDRNLEVQRQHPAADQWHGKLPLQPERVDRLVKTLAESPLLQVHVRKQWWDDIADDGSVISEATPSLSSGSGSASSTQGSATLYSQVNVPFLTEERSPSVVQAILEEEFAQNYPDHPNAKKPSVPSAGIKFGGIALTDPKVHGSPIRYISKDYRLGSKILQVGACSFLDVPYGTSVQSSLRIQRPSLVRDNCTVLLQVVSQVLERKSGKKTFLLVAEVDVTASFTRAALTELAFCADMPLRDIEILESPSGPSRASKEPIDWSSLADELEMSCAITDTIESAAASFSGLTTEFCTMQTLTLMSELERIKTQHQDFMVFRPTGYHENGTPSGINNPWISQHLDQKLRDVDFRSHAQASELTRHLREQVLGAVIDRFSGCTPFDSRIVWEGQIRMIQAVPLLEGNAGGSSRPAAWVCFLSGIQDGLFRR